MVVGVAVVILVLAVGKIRVVMCVVVFPWGFLVFQFSTREVLLGFACREVWLLVFAKNGMRFFKSGAGTFRREL
jgi:hypothetical protein